MKCLIQRVTCASVRVDHSVVGEIGFGLLVFIGVEADDTDQTVARMAQRLLDDFRRSLLGSIALELPAES